MSNWRKRLTTLYGVLSSGLFGKAILNLPSSVGKEVSLWYSAIAIPTMWSSVSPQRNVTVLMKLSFSLFCKLNIHRSENKIAQAFKLLVFFFKVCVLFHVLNFHIWGFASLIKTVSPIVCISCNHSTMIKWKSLSLHLPHGS